MDLLKAELLRKRKATDELKSAAAVVNGEDGANNSGKFIRQKDVRELEEKRRKEMQDELDRQRRTRRKVEEEAESQAKKPRQDIEEKTEEQKVDEIMSISLREVRARLRALRQPITYFGESDADRRLRLIRLEQEQTTATDQGFGLGDGYDIRNTFLGSDSRANQAANKIAKQEDEDEDEDDEEDKAAMGSQDNAIGEDSSGRRLMPDVKFSEIPGIEPHKLIHKYFKSLIKQWEWDLNARSDQEKASTKGRQVTKRQKQCKDYIRPLFKLCKRKEVPVDILPNLVKIVESCENGNFREANDAYILMAIGNAPWPIGLTMVGIHERSGREKISTSKVAHVMNDEMQRKYLTSVKRLMNYAQSKRDDVPPSMKVLS